VKTSFLELPNGPLDRCSALPVEIYNYATQPDTRFQAVAASGVLILVTLLPLMNATAIVIRRCY
jgi:phosphate transport system permease protein